MNDARTNTPYDDGYAAGMDAMTQALEDPETIEAVARRLFEYSQTRQLSESTVDGLYEQWRSKGRTPWHPQAETLLSDIIDHCRSLAEHRTGHTETSPITIGADRLGTLWDKPIEIDGLDGDTWMPIDHDQILDADGRARYPRYLLILDDGTRYETDAATINEFMH